MKWAYFRFLSVEFYGKIKEKGATEAYWDFAKAKGSVEIWLGYVYVSFSLVK